MKKINFFIITVVLLLTACEIIDSDFSSLSPEIKTNDYFVDYHSVELLTNYFDSHTKGSLSSISPFTFRNETVFYIVNYPDNRGWQIISSDQRTPAILAESSIGRFSLDNNNLGLYSWMMCVAEDMYAIRHAENEDLSFSDEEISENIRFWSKEPNRSIDPEPQEDGHWVANITTITEIVDTVPHLTNTRWYQGDPYNKYCPLKSDGSGKRAPAGCVAIAAAQMLYFLHEKWGLPQYMESLATCSGNVNNYTMSQWNLSSTVWNDMTPELCIYDNCSDIHSEAVMIAKIGTLMMMNYGNDGSAPDSSLSFDDLIDRVFNNYGIDCDSGSFTESLVKNNLLAGLPVLVSAKRQWYPNWNFIIPGHTFLIDGYKRTRVKTIKHYSFCPNDPDNYDLSSHPDYEEITYSSPEITSIKMNWGFWTQWFINSDNPTYLNEGWYTLTGDWYVQNGGDYNYKYYRKMIYNFSVLLN